MPDTSPAAGSVTLPVAGWPGLWIRYSVARFLAAAAIGDHRALGRDPLRLILASAEAIMVTDEGEVRDLGEALGLPGPLCFDAELVRTLDLILDGRQPRGERQIARALIGQQVPDAEQAVYHHLLRLGARIKELQQ